MRKGVGVALVTVATLVVVAAVGYGIHRGTGELFDLDASGCTASVDGHTVDVDTEQAGNAALISAISVQRGLPARAASIALATAYQESDLYNIETGDRDSLGLFQQRPSQGWGTPQEIMDPVYSINKFYDALVQVEGYRELEITVAAQQVQRSAFPDAYADHEADARTLASALTGQSPEAFECQVQGDPESVATDLEPIGLTSRADEVRAEVKAVFGDVPLGGFSAGGVSSGHIPGSAHYDGRAVDIFVRPINKANRVRGWAIASYLVAQAERLEVRTLIFDDRIWTAGSEDGWRDYDVPDRPGDRAILEHRDHVHVDVFE